MRERLRIVRAVVRDPRLFRIQAAFFGFSISEYGSWVAMLVYAYDRGGASAAGLVAAIQMIPAGIVAPFGAYAGDRFRRERVLLASYLSESLTLGLVALSLFVGLPFAVTLAFAVLAGISFRFTRPTQASLLPSLCDSTEELTASNAVATFVENAGIVVGPFVAGIMFARWGAAPVFALYGGVQLVGAALVAKLQGLGTGAEPREPMSAGDVVRASFGGFRFLFGQREAGLLMLVMTAALFVYGALDVLFVAVAITLLGKGPAWAGFLSATAGIGGLVGSALAVVLIGRRRLVPALGAGALTYGGPVAAVGTVPGVVTAPVLFAAAGAGGSVAWVAGNTLLQRVAPDEMLTRVFGILEGAGIFAMAVGSLSASAMIAAFGIRGALVVTGALVPVVMLAVWAPIASIDRHATAPDKELISFLRRMPIFAPLDAPAIERIAAHVSPVHANAGEPIVREGEAGDTFYMIVEGEAVVTRDGEHVVDRSPGDSFGEIALLRDVPRTATVTATTAMTVLTLERDPFLEAVTGHPQSQERAQAIVEERLPPTTTPTS